MRSHSWVSPKCIVRPSSLAGKGVFACEPIAEEEVVCVWGGVVVTSEEVTQRDERFPGYHDRCIAVHHGFWLGPVSAAEGDDSEYFNHSCDANTGIKGQIVLVARRPIAVNEEITFDYETAETALPPFICHCGSPLCRKSIDGSASRQLAFREQYAGFLSWHIEQSSTPRGADSSTR